MKESDNVYSETILKSVLENYENIDNGDSYVVLSLFYLLGIECAVCGREFDYGNLENSGVGTPAWCNQVARKLREDGWHVPKGNEGRYRLEATCPECCAG